MATRLLLIDDNRDQVTITTRVLENSGQVYQIESVDNATEGLERIAAHSCDIILCDYRLPDRSGIEILQRLNQIGNDIPFVLVTSVGNERLAVEAMKLGASDYVVKDSSYDAILPEVLQRALERYGEKKERGRLEAERNQAVEALRKEKAHLERMNAAMMGREERILELKKEVNALLEELGRPRKYGA